MRNPSAIRPYQPLNRRAIRLDVKATLIEFARGVLFAFDDQKSDMTKEEYRLRVHYAYVELQRIAKIYNFDPSDFPVPEMKDIPA